MNTPEKTNWFGYFENELFSNALNTLDAFKCFDYFDRQNLTSNVLNYTILNRQMMWKPFPIRKPLKEFRFHKNFELRKSNQSDRQLDRLAKPVKFTVWIIHSMNDNLSKGWPDQVRKFDSTKCWTIVQLHDVLEIQRDSFSGKDADKSC